ncbi:MAG TPA: DUF1080 domain-containing protein [Terriglobales bacterium]|nr:DUF1080 domain-containing protein [Terriglobales bacterium]
MRKSGHDLSRRAFLKSSSVLAVGSAISGVYLVQAQANATASLFDGKTLNGWIQVQNSETSFSGNDIVDYPALAKALTDRSDPVSMFISEQLDHATKESLSSHLAPADFEAAKSALAKDLNKIIARQSLFEAKRFHKVQLRPETRELLKQEPRGRDLVHLNRMLLEDAFPGDVTKSPSTGWIVKDGAMSSTGAGRGVIYTANDYGDGFRLTFTMRHVSGAPDHQACVLIFCTRPQANETPLDALGGIQFQVPNGGHWDYRPGHNNDGGAEFTRVIKPQFDPRQWSRVEIMADAPSGTARMSVSQPVKSKPLEVLEFKDPTAGRVGPIAWQMHNAGLFDEYRDISIETVVL